MRLSKHSFNRLLVRASLYHHGPMSRVELGAVTRLPLSALTSVCGDLIAQGVVAERQRTPAPTEDGRGRPRTLLGIAAEQLGIVGLRHAPDKLDAVVMDLAGEVRWRHGYPAPFGAMPNGLLAIMRQALREAVRASPVGLQRLLAVGCADPGLIERSTGHVLRAVNVPGWEDVPIAQTLRAVHDLPVLLERDESLQALGEVYFGAGRGATSMLYIMLVDEGIGGGLVENGQLVAGRNGGAGEIGHMNVTPVDGPRCDCGLRGCLEAHVKLPRLLERLRALDRTSNRIGDFRSLAEASRQGHEAARQVLSEAADYMARAIGSAVNLLNPQRVVLGGYFADAGEAILAPLRDALPRYMLREYGEGLDIRPAELGNDAAFCGMVAQVRERSFSFSLEGMQAHPAAAAHPSAQERRAS